MRYCDWGGIAQGSGKVFLFVPLLFPAQQVRKIAEKEEPPEKSRLQEYLPVISFYKLYAVIGTALSVPCMLFVYTSVPYASL